MIIGPGADPFGVDLKEAVKRHLEAAGHECVDLGGSSEEQRAYYDVAHELAEMLGSGAYDRGVLVCGTGIGMAIVANKHAGVYAAVCEDAATAARARSINNANVLTRHLAEQRRVAGQGALPLRVLSGLVLVSAAVS